MWVLFLALTVYRCFFNLTALPIERWDEQTNSAVVSDSLSHMSFPSLRLGDQPFFEKPPLWYYVALAASAATGTQLITSRIISAMFGFAVILLTAFIARGWWGPVAGYTAWAVLLTTNHLFVTNPGGIFSTHTLRSADVDSLFILLILLSFGTTNALAAGLWAGLAILTKGPLGMLPILISSVIIRKKKYVVPALRTCFFVIAPWYMYMIAAYGQPFITEHVIYHLGQRTILPIEGHNNPVWYYVSIITNRAFFLSWELVVAAVFWIVIRGLYTKDTMMQRTLLMAGVLFLIPTLTRTRLAWYILPVYPLLAMTIAAAASDFTSHFFHKLRRNRTA